MLRLRKKTRGLTFWGAFPHPLRVRGLGTKGEGESAAETKPHDLICSHRETTFHDCCCFITDLHAALFIKKFLYLTQPDASQIKARPLLRTSPACWAIEPHHIQSLCQRNSSCETRTSHQLWLPLWNHGVPHGAFSSHLAAPYSSEESIQQCKFNLPARPE
jgi:hypothetical protein